MKTRTKVYKKTGLTAAIIILICMIIIMAQSPAKAQKIRKSTDLEYHERLQKAYNWNVSRSNWLKNVMKTSLAEQLCLLILMNSVKLNWGRLLKYPVTYRDRFGSQPKKIPVMNKGSPDKWSKLFVHPGP